MKRPSLPHSLVLAGVLALTAPLLAGCGAGGADAGPGTTVVTSFYPLQYVAQRVVGDRADVVNLTQPGKEPHDLELDFRQTAAVADADVLLYERGFQAAVDDAVDQSHPAHVVDAAQAAHLSGDDPHFWLDPTKLSQVAAAVEEQLAAADPAHRAAYSRNLAGLQSDLATLDRDFRTGLAHCATSTIVVSHDAFGYLGRRYGLQVVGINGLSPDAEPSPAHIRELQDLIRSDKITTVFSERLGSPKFADSLASDLGIRAAVLDPLEGLSDATADQDYLSLMRSNLAALQKANTCS
ncbi:metal ABC transporter substrate-binding protein [Nocardioides panacis]|uniref:Metal ABC transporter substrate-binding protein n=1 Tax=Nocardioides panacis TaxID=2849501 RepID=A0A975XYN1_9ACTN|nr:metal ABC transporter substrate-binding protein [Nocardioides panacis]QWZ06488.1 metal ABC transporter substrate-binding protein [Nocardioides panacis]